MTEVVLLDSGPLGMVCHPRPAQAIGEWLARHADAGTRMLVPENADYEVRRELLRAGKIKGLRRLDRLKDTLGYVPITTEAMLTAAEFWARARRVGRPTAHDKSLDADTILAGQAATLGDEVIIASTNPGHISRFVSAAHWQDIAP